jgi:FtsP/CotA-like multicopper oxidase with cupredoxin domain
MQTRWSDAGKASARRFMRDDQDGLRAVGLAILALAEGISTDSTRAGRDECRFRAVRRRAVSGVSTRWRAGRDAAFTTRSLRFSNMVPKAGWQINGHLFDPACPNATVPYRPTEAWRLITGMHHPIHLHAVQFQVLTRGSRALGPYDHILMQDVGRVSPRI